MPTLDLSHFFPQELKIKKVICNEKEIEIIIFSTQTYSCCPVCQELSSKIKCSYDRTLMDAPIFKKKVILKLTCRKFKCKNNDCVRKVFTERFGHFIKSYARRTDRVEELLVYLAFASNSQTSSRLAEKIGNLVSRDTLLRIIRKTKIATNEQAQVIGVDDFAFLKGNNYGTIICDLETNKPITLLPDRSSDELEKWLAQHPNVQIAARDRSGAYSKAFNNQCPEVIQVADRFHIVHNLLDALKTFTKRTFSSRICIGSETVEVKEKVE